MEDLEMRLDGFLNEEEFKECAEVMTMRDRIEEAFSFVRNGHSNLLFHHIKECDEGNETYYILEAYGGLNGRGKFLFYLEDVRDLVKALMCKFSDVWLIKWENDCPDDTFVIELGLRE